ncbi:MAG: hypothetical protein ACLFTI_04520 [Anaerolineales bacterium]
MSLRTLYQSLLDSNLARLRAIAEQWQIELTADRRADVAAELTDEMARIENVERAWRALTEQQQAALTDLLQRGGAIPWLIFSRRWGDVRAVGPGRLEREALWRDPISPAEGLWYWGFIQRAFAPQEDDQVEMAFVPEELQLYLPTPPPLEIPPPEPAAPPQHILPGDDTLADALVTRWARLQSQRSQPAPDHDPASAEALLETLALEQGWIRVDEQGRRHPVAEPMLAWLRADPWAQWTALVEAWLSSRRWNDLAAVPTLSPGPDAGWPNDPLATRRNFLAVMEHCAADVWYDLTAFVTYIKTHAADFLRPTGNYDVWALRDAASGEMLRGFTAWEAIEGAWVRFVITGPLHWLGLVDLGRETPTSAPDAFHIRSNGAGAALLLDAPPPDLPTPPPVQLGDAGVLRAPRRRRYERFQLSRVARALGRRDNYYDYRLTPTSLARARRQHIPLDRLVDFLTEALGHDLPEPLRAAITQGYEQGEQARVAPALLLQVHDPALLEQPGLARWIRKQLGPRTAVIREADRERVIAYLIEAGILPEISGALAKDDEQSHEERTTNG